MGPGEWGRLRAGHAAHHAQPSWIEGRHCAQQQLLMCVRDDDGRMARDEQATCSMVTQR